MNSFPFPWTGGDSYYIFDIEQYTKMSVKVFSIGRGTSATFGRLWYVVNDGSNNTAIALSNALYSDTVPSDLASGVTINIKPYNLVGFFCTTNNYVLFTTEITFE